jgi:phage/plasmid-like protein (TIGR03299 family)
MSHDITATDNVVLHRKRAWHGLGIIVEDAPTPEEALQIAGLDWDVELTGDIFGHAEIDGQMERMVADRHRLIYRRDTREVFGPIGEGWTPFQNRDLAALASSLAEQGDTVKVETAGSLRGGRRVWFLLKGESFSVRTGKGDDKVVPYILLSNGHDGTMSIRADMTSVRVVCNNTLSMVVGGEEAAYSGQRAAMSYKHTGSLDIKVEELRAALGLYGRSLTKTRSIMDTLAGKDVNNAKVKAFFAEAYERLFSPIPDAEDAGKDAKAKRRRDTAMDAFRSFTETFDREAQQFGPSAWVAANAMTAYAQHERRSNSKDQDDKAMRNLVGTGAQRSLEAVGVALDVFA